MDVSAGLLSRFFLTDVSREEGKKEKDFLPETDAADKRHIILCLTLGRKWKWQLRLRRRETLGAPDQDLGGPSTRPWGPLIQTLGPLIQTLGAPDPDLGGPLIQTLGAPDPDLGGP
uniref:Uncharacterized protein n=1 Tax=Knipowitschia caucasica TaxID=637954 RepID=A0AAV2LVX4_KNICA